MDHRRQAILRDRARLQTRVAEQRLELSRLAAPLAPAIGAIDRGMAAVRYVRAHPWIVGVAVALLVAVRARNLTRIASAGLALWRGTRWWRLVASRLRAR